MSRILDYNKIKTGDKALIIYNDEREEVTIGDIGRTYTDVIFDNGDTRKVILEEVLIELYSI